MKERLQLSSRTKKRPASLPLFCVNGAEDGRVDVAVNDYPALIALPHLVGPQIAPFVNSPTVQREPWRFLPQPDMDTLVEKYGVTSFASPQIDTFSFARMLAKIALALAYGELHPQTGFIEFISNLILKDSGPRILALVGSVDGEWDRNEGPVSHTLRLLREEAGGRAYLTCHIRLFANFGAPAYRVVIGQFEADFDPELLATNLRVTADPRTAHYRLMIALSTHADGTYVPIVPDAQWIAAHSEREVVPRGGIEPPTP